MSTALAVVPSRRVLAWLLLAVAAALALVVGVLFGGGIGFGEALRTLTGGSTDLAARTIVFEYRLPRVLLLALAGAALAVGGAVLQAALQNPLADPSLLGISGGASLGAVAAYTSGLALTWPVSVPLAAFVGALAAITAVYLTSHAAGRPTTSGLLLTGVAVGSLCSAILSILLITEGGHRIHEVFAWLLGSGERSDWQLVRLAVAPVLVGIAGLIAMRRVADALALGEEHALSVGVDVLRGRGALLGLVALSSGSAVSAVGPIAFVGLMVPHFVRPLSGPAAGGLLPAAGIAGAGFLVLCDVLARVVSSEFELPVGIVTALLGVPFFLGLLHRLRSR